MTHTILAAAQTFLADPVTVPKTATPPGSANFLKIAGWLMYACGLACVIGIAKAGGLLAASGSGHGGQQAGVHGVGFVVACVGTVIFGVAGSIALVLS